jgi:predicted dehydrogenase
MTIGFSSAKGEKQLVGTLNLDLIRHDHTRTCTVIGEKGTLRWNGLTGEVDLFEFGASSWKRLYVHEPQRDETYIAEWRDFIDSIQEKKNPQITGDDGLKVLQVIEAARISSSTGTQELTSYIDPIQWSSE